MHIRKQQRHRKHMRTKETAFNKAKKKKKIKGGMPSVLYWDSNVSYILEQTGKTRRQHPLSPPPKKPEQLKSTDDKIIYSWSKPEKTGKNSR